MAKIKQKEQVIKLRKQGLSIRDISQRLETPKSTVSYWCRDIKLSKSQIEKLAKSQEHASMKSILKLAEINRNKRIVATKKFTALGISDVCNITNRDLFMVGLALYWGEGYKKGSQELGFTNSDPEIIKIFIKWLQTIYAIKLPDLIMRVSINNIHKNREVAVLKYWSCVTKVPVSQFTKTSFIKTRAKKEYANHNQHYGTLRVKVRRGTNLRRRILGSISALR